MKKKVSNKKSKQKKIILTSVAVGAAGILGYFGWQYYKRKKKEKTGSEPDVIFKRKPEVDIPPVVIDTPKYNPAPKSKVKTKPKYKPVTDYPVIDIPVASGDFPLKRGSKGDKVKALQEVLIAKHGKQILPRYGADGDFGSELAAALKKLKLPVSIDESTYNVIVQGHKIVTTTQVQQIFNAASKNDFNTTIKLLKQLKTKEDYKQASEEFKTYRLNGGVRQTLVNGLLNTFTKDEQKQAIRFEFLRMGLQFDGNKWSLSGFDGISIVTIEPATIWANSTEAINVPARMVLGNEITRRLDYTLFENNGKHFLVQTRLVRPL